MTQLLLPLLRDEDAQDFIREVRRESREVRRQIRLERIRRKHPYEALNDAAYDDEALEDVTEHLGARVLWPGCLN